ncbi:hypothetical protein [Methylobacterium sp. yr668]|uniref:hypothetical protein n=1 Tax=Methylobacterium sp. yr668 TaxID=1761801 RepID=UPI0008E46568|nr:hypothetical protein [Methylobacterium sp. yr668]SFT22827.1 hypothetical protein SAMN04487845_12742 [Methylobacterium sp. yr668]
MHKYLVTFHKVVPDDIGHEHTAIQRQTVVSAHSEAAAACAAQALFCQTAGIVDWRMRADTCEVAELDGQAA